MVIFVDPAVLAEARFPFTSEERIDDYLLEEPGTEVLQLEEMPTRSKNGIIFLLPPHELEMIATAHCCEEEEEDYRYLILEVLMESLTPIQRQVIEWTLAGNNTKKITKLLRQISLERFTEGDVKLCLHCSIEKMKRILEEGILQ